MVQVQLFSKGKNSDYNEDYFEFNNTSFVIADGATDKSGMKYNGKTGGEIISKFVAEESLNNSLSGIDLIKLLNKKLKNLYKIFNITDKIKDPIFRFTCGCIVVRIIQNEIIITYVGDLGFRINGEKIYQEIKQVDVDNANRRAEYIKNTGDIVGSREYIHPFILEQYKYQNNPDHPLGYGVIDGTYTPEKFIKVFRYKLSEVKTIELFTDGYFKIPTGTTIDDWENSYQEVEREDPDKWKKYKSTKSKDDRTIAIISF